MPNVKKIKRERKTSLTKKKKRFCESEKDLKKIHAGDQFFRTFKNEVVRV